MYDQPGLSCTFELDVPAKWVGSGPERFAEQMNPHFKGDVEEYCLIALRCASRGPSANQALTVISRVGTPAHIVLDGYTWAGGLTEHSSYDEAFERFMAWGLWYNPDDNSDDADGVMVKFWCTKYTRKGGQPVSQDWESENIGMFKYGAIEPPCNAGPTIPCLTPLVSDHDLCRTDASHSASRTRMCGPPSSGMRAFGMREPLPMGTK